MSTHIVNKLQNGGVIPINIHFNESVCLTAIRLKLMKVGHPNGSFKLSFSYSGHTATSIVTTAMIEAALTKTNFNGYIAFFFDDIFININKGEQFTIQTSFETEDYDGDDENFVALVYELTDEFKPYYGVEIYSIG